MNIFTKLFGVRGLRIVMCAAVIALAMTACDTTVGGGGGNGNGNGNGNGDSDPFEGTWYGFMQEDEGQVWLKIVAKDGEWSQQMYMGSWGDAADGTYSVSGDSVTITIANAMGTPYGDLSAAMKEQVGPQIQTVTISSKEFTQRGIKFTQTVPDFDKPLNPDDLFEGTWYGFNEARNLWLKFDAADDKWTQQMYMGSWTNAADGTYSVSGNSVTITIVNAMGIPYNELSAAMKEQVGPQIQTAAISSNSFTLGGMEFTHTEPEFGDPNPDDPFAGNWYSDDAGDLLWIDAANGKWTEVMYVYNGNWQDVVDGTYSVSDNYVILTIVNVGDTPYDDLSAEEKVQLGPKTLTGTVAPNSFIIGELEFTHDEPVFVDPVNPEDPFAGEWYSEEYMDDRYYVRISAEEGHWTEFIYTGTDTGWMTFAQGTYTINADGIVNTIVNAGLELSAPEQDFKPYDQLSQEMKNLIIQNDNNFSVSADGFDTAGKKFTNENPTTGY